MAFTPHTLTRPDGTKKCMRCARELSRDERCDCAAARVQPPAPRSRLDCRHLGPQIATAQCPSCQGHVQLKIFSCAQFGRCSIGKETPGAACCGTCDRYEAALAWRVPQAPRQTVDNPAVITSFFNPQNYRRPLANYHRFAAGIAAQGLPLFVAELAFDADSFVIPSRDNVVVVRRRGTRARNLMFQKERLLNLLLDRLPERFDAVAWIDADVEFLNRHWVDETLAALSSHHAAQLWEACYELEPDGRLTPHPQSSGKCWRTEPASLANFRLSHPGFAWAARADWLRRYRLFDQMITGGGDVNIMHAMTGRPAAVEKFNPAFSPGYIAAARAWETPVHAAVAGSVGCVHGSILHLHHGTAFNRRYADRWKLLIEHQFDPAQDVALEPYGSPAAGLWAWSDAARQKKPELIRQVAECFASRREDD